MSPGPACFLPSVRQVVDQNGVQTGARPLSHRAWCPTGASGASAAYTISLRVSSTDSGHLTPFEAGFSLSSGADPAKDVILRIEAESNEETRVRG